MSFISDIFSSSVGTVINAVGDSIDKIVTSDEEKIQLNNILEKVKIDADNELEKIKLNETISYLQDTQNARNRQIEHEKAVKSSDINLYMLAWMIVIGFFALIITMIFIPVPTDSSGVVFMLFGSLSAGFGSVIGYFFGSSKSSNDKTSLLAKVGQK